jgi:thiamine kinase-like enzyme
MSDDIGQARDMLVNIPLFYEVDPDSVTITRLGGLTNLVFRLDWQGESVCLRLPGKGTEDYIDRQVEGHNARMAAEAGVSPEVLYFDPQSAVLITRFLDGCVTMTPTLFGERPGAPGRAGRAFRQLHGSEKPFAFRFELFAMIDDYLGILSKNDCDLPDGYKAVLKQAESIREALAAHPAALAPCHCDPLCENFLDDGTRMWIVEWEYSGMNDPLWDLGDLSVEAGFDARQEAEMMRAYFDREPTAAETGRMAVYKAMCDLLWTLWGLIQHANDNPADDFWAYATGRLDRCKALMADPAFAGHVAAVRMG